MLGAILGAGASLAGGLLGYSAQSEANEMNYQIALLNYYEQKRQFDKAQQLAEKLRAEGKLGETDVWGNHTYFDPVKGWVTDASERQQMLLDLYEKEELQQLTHDLPAKRKVMDRNLERQAKEADYSSALFDAMKRVQMQDPQDRAGLLNQMSAEGIARGFEPAVSDAVRGSLRVGNERGAAEIASRIGIEQGEALRQAFMQNQLGAREQVQREYDRELGGLNALYQQFAASSSQMPDVQYNPRNIEGSTANLAASASAGGRAADAALLNTTGREYPNFNYQAEPNMGLANTIAGLGPSFEAIDQRNQADQFYNQQASRYGGGSRSDYTQSQLAAMFQEGRGAW